MDKINEFKGAYRFLSNFYRRSFMYRGQEWFHSEGAYMAEKTTDEVMRQYIRTLENPAEAKAAGRRLVLRPDWETVKYGLMVNILQAKFSTEPLKSMLLNTGDAELVEGNWWGDKVWGVCLKTNVGQNLLGKALMQVRAELKQSQLPDIRVVNKYHGEQGEYIGRGSPLGNQWTHLDSKYPGVIKVASREIAIAEYRGWLATKIINNDKAVCDELNRLVDIAHREGRLELRCTCAPKACHGDVIREVILTAWSEQ